MLDFKFCRDCGSPAREEFSGYYDPQTGEKKYYAVCSKNHCHTEHAKVSQPLFARGDWKCSRCGQIGWDPCYF